MTKLKSVIKRKFETFYELTHLNHEEEKALISLCEEYSDIFHLDGEPLSYINGIAHEITIRKLIPQV